MRSARASAASSAARSRGIPSASDFAANNGFQMPSYTSHACRKSPSKASQRQSSPQKVSGRQVEHHAEPQRPAFSDSDQNLLAMLNSTVACLKEKHMDIEALGCLEQSLWLKRRMFGIDSAPVLKALKEVVLSYNSIAMQYLAQGQFDQCLSMLRKAEAITAPGNFKKSQSLQILTYNNIGCCYRKLGKLKSALKYLKEAAQVGAGCAHVKNLSITHLNLCAIQSQLGRHDLALEHAQSAIFHTQEELVCLEEEAQRRSSEDDDGELGSDVLDAKSREEKIVSLAVAYHNLAVELEFNGRGEASLQWYKKALQLVWKYRDSNEALCNSFQKIFLDAKKKYETHSTANSTNASIGSGAGTTGASGGRQAILRPKSARPLSRTNHASASNAQRDVSYSATVASHCYKPTKPSAAGQQYNKSPPKTKLAQNATSTASLASTQQSRPSSATSARRRPLSASTARVATARARKPDDDRELAQVFDPIELRWEQIEKVLFGRGPSTGARAAHRFESPPKTRDRPKSARPVRVDAPADHQSATEDQTGRVIRCEDDGLADEDAECGVVEDEDDDEDVEAEFSVPVYQRSARIPNSRAIDRSAANEVLRSEDARLTAPTQSRQAPSGRHRRVLRESRGRVSSDEDEDEGTYSDSSLSIRRVHEGNSETSNGYLGENDTDGEFSTAESSSTSSDVPRNRVSHMEYLRRMKLLAENIREDTGAPIESGTAKPLCESQGHGDAASRKSHPRRTMTEDFVRTSTTPRGATSKVRERIELVRRDSAKDLKGDLGNTAAPAVARKESVDYDAVSVGGTTSASVVAEISTLHINEDVCAFQSDNDVRAAEWQQVRDAAARRVQATIRASAARSSARKLKQRKHEQEAARLVRARTQKLLDEAKQREDEVQSIRQQAELENAAAKLIQNSYRRKFCPDLDEATSDLGNDPEYTPVNTARSSAREERPSPLVPQLQLESVTGRTSIETAAMTTRSGPDVSRSSLSPHTLECATTSTPSSARPATTRQAAITERLLTPTPRRLSLQHAREHAAAVSIQSSFRSFGARHHVAVRRARRMSRSYIEAQHMNVVLHQALSKEQEMLERLSAVKIQALVRGRQARLLIDAERIGQHAAASKIQTNFRRHNVDMQRSTARGARSIAVRLIQQVFRTYARRQAQRQQVVMNEEMFEVHHIAAATIQKLWRQSRSAREHRLEEFEAATCIQALGRGHLTRKSLQSLRASTSNVALSKTSSAFSMTASGAQINEEIVDDYDDPFEDDSVVKVSARTINFSFLPPLVREMYLRYTGAEVAPAKQLDEFTVNDIDAMGLSLDDFMQELDRCIDVGSACSSVDAMSMLVEAHPDRFRTLQNLVKVARVFDRRIQDSDFWALELERRAIAFIRLFEEIIGC